MSQLSYNPSVDEINVQQSMAVYFEIYTESNQNVCYHHFMLLLLLAGDIELNPGPGPMIDILKAKSASLTDAMSADPVRIANELYAKELIPRETKLEMHIAADSIYTKASKLMNAIEGQLAGLEGLDDSLYSRQYLINFCKVLINQHSRSLADLVKSMLDELG
uniref:Uncharacterized protein n=1 Tax=Amphimedon queenslandica TaxID=400682 RepID=A0A1X7STS3_AMPQE